MAGGMAAQASGTGVFFAPAKRLPAVESWTLTAAEVDAWVKRARVGDVLRYAHGPSLIQGAAAARIRALIDSQDVMALPQKRVADGGFDYRVVRTRVRVVRSAPAVLDPAMSALLLRLKECARLGLRCPSDAELGKALGGTPDQAKWAMRKLVAAKAIETRIAATPKNPKFRVVRIVDSGAETALPGAGE